MRKSSTASQRLSRFGGLGAFAVGIPVGVVLGRALSRTLGDRRNVVLPNAIDAETREFRSHAAGTVRFYVDDFVGGRPLVLLHGVHACASAYEVKSLFERFRRERTVIAPDLPGFGISPREDVSYTRRIYASFVEEFVRAMAAKYGEVDVVALSLSCEFAARAALANPAVRSLTFLSPTGFSARSRHHGRLRADADHRSTRLHRVFRAPVVGSALYETLTTKTSIGHYLGKAFQGPVDEGFSSYAFATARQPGARHAPLAFISGRLFDPEIRQTVYEELHQPVLVVHGTDGFTTFDLLSDTVTRRPNWRVVPLEATGSLPHVEQAEITAATLEAFWSGLDEQDAMRRRDADDADVEPLGAQHPHTGLS